MVSSKDLVKQTIKFESPERLGYDLPDEFGTDFYRVVISPSPDDRPQSKGVFTDEWGAIWENIGTCNMGEVKEYPLKEWKDFDKLKVPDISAPNRWHSVTGIRKKVGDKFLLGYGISIYERVHFLRGLENTWIDIYTNPDELGRLIDILVDMNIYILDRYAEENIDGFYFCDDWGLQNKLMISPEMWQKIWKPRYAKIYKHAHDLGILTFLHSCGYIVDILDDLIEVGLDVVHMDQQENMTLELLSKKFSGKITFFSPADIQTVMVNESMNDIENYCEKMVKLLGTSKGGFLPKWYRDPVGAGHTKQAVNTMSRKFVELAGKYKNL